MTNRKGRHRFWIKANSDGSGYDSAGNFIDRETLRKWDSEANRRLNRLSRYSAKGQIDEQLEDYYGHS